MAEAATEVDTVAVDAAKPAQGVGGLTPAMLDRAVKQIEFYLSDSNLPRDKFLLDKVHSSPDGWVDLGLIATFVRMRDILKARAARRDSSTPNRASGVGPRADVALTPARAWPLLPNVVALGGCRGVRPPVAVRRLQMTAPRIPPATIAAIAQALRVNAPSLVGASAAASPLSSRPCCQTHH
jgi:hypothetical protein